jgi:AAA+ superfamily predicted ATPase
MQKEIEAYGWVGTALEDFVKTVPVNGPDGKQQPHKLESLLESDILALAANFTRADLQVSDRRTHLAFIFRKFVRSDLDAIGHALIKNRPTQTDDELTKLKINIEKQWDSIRLVEPLTLALLQSYDHTFGTKYVDPARNLLRRVAFQFLNADGSPSSESQRLFDNYESLLAKPDGAADPPLRGETENQLLQTLLSDFIELGESATSKYEEWSRATFPTITQDPYRNNYRFGMQVEIYELVGAFGRADGHLSFAKLKCAFFVSQGMFSEVVLAEIPETTLAFFQKEMKPWMTAPLERPRSISLLTQVDKTLGTAYADRATKLFLRLATLLLNADGPPSNKSQRLFAEYNSLLQGSVSGAQRAVSTVISSNSNPGLETLLGELNSLIGLGQVKQDVRELANYINVQKLRRAKGLKAPEISLHMVFHGNPGTGKTTVARLLSKIYRALGVVSKGHLVETDRSDLVAGYVGQTALKVKAVAEKSLGGILFIDEAYSLKRGNDSQDYGNEAVETLLKFMEDNRQDLVVIVAGYPVEMKRFLDANPGLQSRFNKSLSFPDYQPEELMQIFLRLCTESDYKLSEDARVRLSTYFQVAYQKRDLKFGNARLVRNIFEKVVTNVANRVVQDSQTDSSALELIEGSDVATATG